MNLSMSHIIVETFWPSLKVPPEHFNQVEVWTIATPFFSFSAIMLETVAVFEIIVPLHAPFSANL